VYYRVFSTFENTPKHTPTTSTTNFHRGSNVFWCGFGVVLFFLENTPKHPQPPLQQNPPWFKRVLVWFWRGFVFFGKHTQTPPTTSTTKSTVVQPWFNRVLVWFGHFWKNTQTHPNHLYNTIHRCSTVYYRVLPCISVVL
jgi:hypothetical protein